MATYTPTTPIDGWDAAGAARASGGAAAAMTDRRSGSPNYGARLRRARLGLICGIATVSMVFISLTSAYVVRQGLPTFDGATEHLCSRLGPGAVALAAAGHQYCVAADQQFDDGIRAAGNYAASGAGSGGIDSREFRSAKKEAFPGWV